MSIRSPHPAARDVRFAIPAGGGNSCGGRWKLPDWARVRVFDINNIAEWHVGCFDVVRPAPGPIRLDEDRGLAGDWTRKAPLRQMQSLMITCIAVTGLAVPTPLEARGRRDGGVGARGAGQVNLPPVNTPQVDVPHAAGRVPEWADVAGRQGGLLGGAGLDGRAATAASIELNAALPTRVRPMLPPGSNMGSAVAGFRNESDFLAALHASRSLGISFDDVKGKMTEGRGRRLGDAIQAVRPELDKKAVKQNVKDAERSAREDTRAATRGHAGAGVHSGGPAAAEIRMNKALSVRAMQLLPDGKSLEQASVGFPDTGQFAAALHASRNLGIPFSELRTDDRRRRIAWRSHSRDASGNGRGRNRHECPSGRTGRWAEFESGIGGLRFGGDPGSNSVATEVHDDDE